MNSLMMTQFRGPPAYGNLVTHPHMPFAPQTTNMAPLQHPPSLLSDFGMQFGPMSRPDPPASNEIPKTATLKHVKLAAFNIFGASVREDFQKRRGNTSGRDVEKWIGQRWREMDQIERQKYHDLASKELERRGGAMVSKKKRRKQEAEEREKRKSAKKRSTKESSVSIERDRTASTTTTNPNQLIGLLTEGVVDDVFDGGFFSTLTIAGHRPVRAMVFHPLLAKIDE